MKRELGIARCGLACCLCSENDHCSGCSSNDCPDKDWCENRKCSIEKQYAHCYDCKSTCRKGLLSKIKPYGFTVFVKRYGEAERRSFWTALQGTKKRVLSIIAKGSAATMTPSTMWSSCSALSRQERDDFGFIESTAQILRRDQQRILTFRSMQQSPWIRMPLCLLRRPCRCFRGNARRRHTSRPVQPEFPVCRCRNGR